MTQQYPNIVLVYPDQMRGQAMGFLGHVAPRRDDLLLSVPDVCPTLLELAGLWEEIPQGVEGTSYAPLLLGQDVARPGSQLYLRMPHDNPAEGRRGVRTSRYTYVADRMAGDSVQRTLYDRLEDPYQLRDIAGARPEVVRRLSGELDQWLEATGDPWILSAEA